MDTASHLLTQVINCENYNDNEEKLWLIDENITLEILDRLPDERIRNIHCLSNRIDVINHITSKGNINSTCNDFEWGNKKYDYVFLRASKEKQLCFHLISLAIHSLKSTGHFVFSCGKKEGLKSYLNFINAHINADIYTLGKEKTSQCIKISNIKIKTPFQNTYHHFSQIKHELTIYSKPGQFGWKKIDQGSQLLASHFPTIYESFSSSPKQVLDLGCGYGFLILNTAQFSIERWATDNNITALNSCTKNCETYQLACTTVLDDAASNIQKSFDWVICNPPFHHGFKTSPELLIRFLSQAKRVLNTQGKACFVTNQFIPLEREAKKLFSKVNLIDHKNGFNIHILSH